MPCGKIEVLRINNFHKSAKRHLNFQLSIFNYMMYNIF